MSRKLRNTMLLVGALLVAACGPRRASQAAPDDPIGALQVAPLPVGSLAGSSALVLVAGTVVFGDSTQGLLPRRAALLEAANAQLDTALRAGAREVTWHGLAEQRRAMRRNPALRIDPDRLPTSYLIAAPPHEQVPEPLWTDIRMLAALTGARFAVVPVAVRIAGTPVALTATYAIIAVDARTGRIVWRGRMEGRPAATPEAALAGAAAALVPGPIP